MVPDRWYSMYHYSHPPLVERLRAIRGHPLYKTSTSATSSSGGKSETGTGGSKKKE